ncbi:helix-turn-helix domain-containing protein [Proteus mirabilis]|uniref:helix-turn-helix domain-containing protein n=2 Tax=Proteus mirabilis TaxID=584 RepID=UPI001E3CA178|nr:helix-turn-helix domain-containing protein [Proteus mirabilis]MCD4599995.1 helix-turn-helix domain-containing protein [Proteus mirabilis]
MLYYIYVLSGPLKGIITPLLPNQYSLILHSKEHIENKIENEKLTLYIPCNKKEHEKIITIMLDEHNTKNNKYKIEDGLISKEISKELPLEHLIINEALKDESQLEPLFVTIRHSESYWLILHLISYLDEKKSNIAQIGERYGVSGTHFRRLCKRYLGNCGKSQLRSWRAASSILTTLSTDESLTQIAVDNGFSSASHFSNEIKTLFGITPTEFRRIGQYLYEHKK